MTHTRSNQGRIRHYVAKDEIMVSECLVRHFALTAEEAARLISFGAVYSAGLRVDRDRPLARGEYVRVHLQPKRFPVEGIDWRATITSQTDDFLVVNKPAGIPVHATLDNQVENVLHQLRVVLGVSVYVTQRLDTEVGGLMVFAKTQEFQRRFNQLLSDRKVKKQYLALVNSAPDVGKHIHYMEPSERSPKTVSAERQPNWLECVLQVVSVESVDSETFQVEVDLETGRTHQIRAQLAALGCPIVGDKLYGSRARYSVNGTRLPGIGLFSASTTWSSSGKEWTFQLSPPWH